MLEGNGAERSGGGEDAALWCVPAPLCRPLLRKHLIVKVNLFKLLQTNPRGGNQFERLMEHSSLAKCTFLECIQLDLD